ncbi:FAD/NAD(P)-binding domain-containing protein [Lindgomyces ingoldianus]|uniref:FAD/NAD(P)-binding domain-containing protein n=1 Tax=Lindgomyces ingoldianus TaxID=673940 RepID=A0ACB6R907_9PLEO|nr:FAD/NAD(P)-binding domain-containing protein [Lindgomyces ingoldianus]KAF2475002.1 FAD/NAD(P)-binding domain-containing protein [Lindgomyces ingoldianus]
MTSIQELKLLPLNEDSANSLNKTNGVYSAEVQELDVLVVGAGFGGVYQLKSFRDHGYRVKLVEAGTDYGGVWYWNRYPGARVDTTIPLYEFSDPDLWKDWTWRQRFPGSAELRAYFAHVADKWNLRKDTEFNTFVSSASWDDVEAKWVAKTKNGRTYKVKFLSISAGFAAKRYIPGWKGIEKFKGIFVHPSYWPHEEPNLRGKRIAVIGAGSTGVQLATDLSKVAEKLHVFIRTPNTCMPMRQVNYNLPEQAHPRSEYPDLFNGRKECFSGFDFDFIPRSTFDDSLEERLNIYEKLWAEGDFKFWLATYKDMLFVESANREAYNFWRDKTRARIHKKEIADILAPMKQLHAFGCKRISLENGYFEIFNEPHVHLVDMKATPIEEITEKGIKTSEKEFEFDYIICATGFDALTGGLSQIDIKGPSGESLSEHWVDGCKTYLGMSVSGFPNLFFTYGPQAPTAFCNGPTCAELQGDWIVNVINHMKLKGLRRIEAEAEGEKKWKEDILRFANASLLPTAKSWYMGDNIPGKPREPLIYLGGVPTYYKTISECAANGYMGFRTE